MSNYFVPDTLHGISERNKAELWVQLPLWDSMLKAFLSGGSYFSFTIIPSTVDIWNLKLRSRGEESGGKPVTFLLLHKEALTLVRAIHGDPDGEVGEPWLSEGKSQL